MAEKSPRPEAEEDGDEEGEEAAEAPLRPARVVTVKKDESAAAPPDSPPPPPPGEAEEAPLLASPPSSPNQTPQPAVPDPAAYPQGVPLYPADHPSVSGVNLFANDGSFLELFKKKMEAGNKEENKEESKEPEKRRPVSLVGKRRGGAKLALKTGIVAKKPKTEDEEILTHKGGAWAQYMAEVKKYKAHQCSDDDKTRPLVK